MSASPSPHDERRVLVTGSSGFIGTNLVDHLLARGHAVAGFSRRPPQDPRHAGVFVKGDVLDTASLSRALTELRATDVVHLAAATVSHHGAAPPDYGANRAGTHAYSPSDRPRGAR